MLARHEFCDLCPGCRPALFDAITGKVLTADTPTMIVVNRVWDHDTTFEERKAFIAVTLHNSREPQDMARAGSVIKKFTAALHVGPKYQAPGA